MYVITLSMSPAVAREDAPSLLAARARGLMVANGCELIYSESRMPGLRKWVEHWCRENSRAFETLREEDTARLANQYFGLTRYDVDTGMVLPRDPMLAFCVQLGNMPQRLVPNAYRDEQSMNYGVVCVMPNPIPLSERTDDRVAAVSARFLQASHSLEQANALLAGELERNE